MTGEEHGKVSLFTIAREWGVIGCIGFGGPPAHISLLRRLCVERRQWISAEDFEDGIAACNLLPGPASTQLSILCAWRLRRAAGALVGGACFILPGLVVILALAALFLEHHPPTAVLAAAAGGGAAVPAVALNAARGFVPASWKRIGTKSAERARWVAYAAAGALSAAVIGEYLVLVLLACGILEVVVRRRPSGAVGRQVVAGVGLLWVAFKVGALSYGGGFVIVPLMQHDVVSAYHWMTGAQFLNAVALGQVTPGPVVLTVGVVGYAAGGLSGGLIAVAVAFAPSFAFVIGGAPHFDRIRRNDGVQAFLTGAGPAVIGGIAGSAVPLGLELGHLWQVPLLALAIVALGVERRAVVPLLLAGAAIGMVVVAAGLPA